MNRREVSKLIGSMRLPLTALERIELIELMFMDSFKKSEKKPPSRIPQIKEHHFDAMNEMAFEGAQITRGMRMLFSEDPQNKRDMTNYYQSI